MHEFIWELIENIITVIIVLIVASVVIGLVIFGAYEMFWASNEAWWHLLVGAFAWIFDIALCMTLMSGNYL